MRSLLKGPAAKTYPVSLAADSVVGLNGPGPQLGLKIATNLTLNGTGIITAPATRGSSIPFLKARSPPEHSPIRMKRRAPVRAARASMAWSTSRPASRG